VLDFYILGMVVTPLEAAYAAGVFDAEGSLGIYRYDPPDYYHVAAALYNSESRLLEWFQTRWGGRLIEIRSSVLSRLPERRLVFRTGETKALLEAISPYLITKAARARAVRRFIELTYGRGWNRRAGRPAWLRLDQTRLFLSQAAPINMEVQPSSPSDVDKAYAAGLVDGDGHLGIRCIQIDPPRRDIYSPSCSISSVSVTPLRWLQSRWGGTMWRMGANRLSRQQGWTWQPRTAERLAFLRDISPRLRLKHAVGVNLLRLCEITFGKPYEHRPAAIFAEQTAIYARYLELTRRPTLRSAATDLPRGDRLRQIGALAQGTVK
jgi:hypothetical protein